MLGNIFILGDSYSTFEGYIPEGYASYYFEKGPYYLEEDPDKRPNANDVSKVEQTWWYPLVKENGNLILNCSWSGTTICNTGYNGTDNSKNSFVARIKKLTDEGFFKENKIDTLFLFGGTNDSWANAPLGKAIYSGWNKEDLNCVLPAFSYLVDLLVKRLDAVKIYCILNNELKDEISRFYRSVCRENGIDVIELHDIDKVCGHPTVKGMGQIKDQVLDYVKSRM